MVCGIVLHSLAPKARTHEVVAVFHFVLLCSYEISSEVDIQNLGRILSPCPNILPTVSRPLSTPTELNTQSDPQHLAFASKNCRVHESVRPGAYNPTFPSTV